MINDVIQQIIDLDNRAIKIKNNATARAAKIENDTRNELKEKATKIITETKEQGKENYNIEIQKAEVEKNDSVSDMEKSIRNVREQYEQSKTDGARRVLEELFQSI
ncbi:MAG: hypothetical protein RR310_07690 [Eubacterium sp.]